jgi:hypothetical protein
MIATNNIINGALQSRCRLHHDPRESERPNPARMTFLTRSS